MMEKMAILIFRPEIPYCESINVVYFLGSQLSVFSRKDTKTLLLDITEGSRIF